jgi:tellurite resistance protein
MLTADPGQHARRMKTEEGSKPAPSAVAGAAPARRRLTPNLFSISFGFAGLAECWSTAAAHTSISPALGDALWIVAAAAWALVAVAYVSNVVRGGRARTELLDGVYAPFVSLGLIVPMMLGVALAPHARTVGATIFAVSLALLVVLGGWLTGQWIITDHRLERWHPGYFLPTVAAGLLAAAGSALLGYHDLARLMLGYGMVCWLIIGSILLLRLFTQPQLPVPLLPTLAIEVAPPVVAGAAWFDINGGRADTVALMLAGYGVLMVLIQVRLVPLFRQVPFGPGWWAFSFSYAAVFVNGIQWLAAEHVTHQLAWTYALLAVVSAAIMALAVRTTLALVRGTFLPPAPKA